MREKKVGTTGVALGERESGLYTYEREFCAGRKEEVTFCGTSRGWLVDQLAGKTNHPYNKHFPAQLKIVYES